MNKGKILAAEPLTTLDDVEKVRRTIESDLRATALFRTGTNSALRASDLLKLKRTDLKGNELLVRERKTGKVRRITLNEPTVQAINAYLLSRADTHEWMFVGQRGKMTHGYLSKLIKSWFIDAGIPPGRFSSHTLRKTFCRIQHEVFGVSIGTLMTALRHSTEAQTLHYVGLNEKDVAKAYENEI